MRLARENGFDSVTAELVPGGLHTAMPEQVLAFFASHLRPDERR
jgi:hypothetical protein